MRSGEFELLLRLNYRYLTTKTKISNVSTFSLDAQIDWGFMAIAFLNQSERKRIGKCQCHLWYTHTCMLYTYYIHEFQYICIYSYIYLYMCVLYAFPSPKLRQKCGLTITLYTFLVKYDQTNILNFSFITTKIFTRLNYLKLPPLHCFLWSIDLTI